MPITLTKLVSKTADVTIAFEDGDTLTVQYWPNRINEETFAQLQIIDGISDARTVDAMLGGFKSLNGFLVDIVKGWDLFENDGITPFPITLERLPEIPIAIRSQILWSILGDIRKNQKAPEAS